MTIERVKALRAEIDALDAKADALEKELDGYRVQCPDCACRPLPDEECRCCAARRATGVVGRQVIYTEKGVHIVEPLTVSGFHRMVDPKTTN